MTDHTDLVKRLRFRMNLDDPQLAADAIEAQAARIAELTEQLQLANMDCFTAEARVTLLESIVVCAVGDLRNGRTRAAFERLKIEEKIITALEGKDDE